MEKIKEFWNKRSNADRRKIIVYTIAGIVCVGLLAIVIALNSTSTETEVADFTNPDAQEVAKYNSRTEANQMKKDSADLNLAMDNLFAENNNSPITTPEDNSTFYEPSYSPPANTGYQQPTYSSPSGSSGGSYNSHSTYGDYSMWQSEEPKNNSVGYTNKKGAPQKVKAGKEPDYTEIPNNGYQEPSYQGQDFTPTKSLSDGKQIRAKLLSQGYATSGRSLSFVLLEPTTIAGVSVPKGQVVTGVAAEQNNRLLVNFSSIKVKNKVYQANLQLFGSDGMAGLPIGGGGGDNQTANKGKDIVANQANRIPVVGGIIGSAVRNSGNSTPDNKIKLSSNIECVIVNYN